MPKVVDKDERRRELAEAVWRVIRRDGVENASVRNVAREAGLSTGSLRHYFATQSELLQFAMRTVMERVEARVAGIEVPDDPLRAAKAVLAQLLPLDEERRAENEVWVAFSARAMVDDGLRALRDEAYDALRAAADRWTRSLLTGAGEKEQDLEAERLFALIDGLAIHAALRPDAATPDLLSAVLEHHLDQLARRGRGRREDPATFIHRWAGAIVSNDVTQMEEFTTEDWVLVDKPGAITRDAFHAVVDNGALRHHRMTHEVLDIQTHAEVAVVRTRGRNAGTFNGEHIAADEWTTNILVGEADRWRCALTQLTPTAGGGDDVRVERVTPGDWGRFRAMRLAALAESPSMFGSTLAREEAFDEDEWRRRAERPVSFLASRDGREVGLAGVHELDGVWTVVSMWIAPDARGSGVVDALMEACENVVRDAGASTLVLGVMEDNPAGCKAYQRLGYTFTGRRDHIRDGRDELWMEKRLEGPSPSARTAR